MMVTIFSNTKTLTGRLALFFTLVSLIIGSVIFLIFYAVLHWSEDNVSERRILIDRDSAIELFLTTEEEKIQLDTLTTAYNNMALLPADINVVLQDEVNFLGETESLPYIMYKGQYTDNGVVRSIVLVTEVERVELSNDELFFLGILVNIIVIVLLIAFGALLYRLSQGLIEPVNDISHQLNQLSGDTDAPFTMSSVAAQEFKLLVKHLNQYRRDLNQALKREQVFARYSSHELRTPLTVVKGANKILSQTPLTEKQARQITRIEHATLQMTTMVDALLSIVRYERDGNESEFRSISEPELNKIIADNAQQASEKKVKIELFFTGAPTINASNAVLNMVLGNIIRNSIAASQQGILSIEVNEQGISVIDDGEGLLDKPNSEGHGLGLMIVDDICERYNWIFTLEQHETRGCIAKVQF